MWKMRRWPHAYVWSAMQCIVWMELEQHQQMMFFQVIQQNQCTHLGVFAVVAGQALERRVIELHLVGW